MDLQLTGRRAIVTGGSRGIGKKVAEILAAEGAHVAIVSRNQVELDAAAAELGKGVFGFSCDTGSDDSVKAMSEHCVERLGGVDILVNCAARPAGQAPALTLAELTEGAIWSELNIKVMGYLRCIRELAPHMQAGGRIVNVGGLATRTTGSTIGSIRNAAVSALTKNLADELGPLGIAVIVVHPAITRTESRSTMIKARAMSTGVTEEEVERAMVTNSLGRMIDATEVAQVIVFLCSSKSIAINGDAIAVGGGIRGPIHY